MYNAYPGDEDEEAAEMVSRILSKNPSCKKSHSPAMIFAHANVTFDTKHIHRKHWQDIDDNLRNNL